MSMTPNATLQFLLGRVPSISRGPAPAGASEFAAVFAAAAGEAGEEQTTSRQPPRLLMTPAAVHAPERTEAEARPTAADRPANGEVPDRAAGARLTVRNLQTALPAGAEGAAVDAQTAQSAAPARVTVAGATPIAVTPEPGEPATPAAPAPSMPAQAVPTATPAPITRNAAAWSGPVTPAGPLASQPGAAPAGEPGEAILQRLTKYLTAATASDGQASPEPDADPLPAANQGDGTRQPPASAVAAPVTLAASATPAAPQAAAIMPRAQTRAIREAQADRQGASQGQGDVSDGGTERPHRDGLRDPLRAQALPLRRGVSSHTSIEDKPLMAPSKDTLTVTRRETHFAPVRRPASVDAHLWTRTAAAETAPPRETPKVSFAGMAEQIKPALEQARTDLETRAPQLLQAQQAAIGAKLSAPVRVIEISLQPASLGALAVTMRITGSGLRVSISASQRETAAALEEDLDKLTALVREAGLDPEAVEVVYAGSSVEARVH